MAVYFIQEIDDGGLWVTDDKPIKIGYSADKVNSRLHNLQTGSPVRLGIKAIIEWGDEALEQRIHRKFRHTRLTGEWFTVDREMARFIGHYVYWNPTPERVNDYLEIPTDEAITYDLTRAVRAYEKHMNVTLTVMAAPNWKQYRLPWRARFKVDWLIRRYWDFRYWLKQNHAEIHFPLFQEQSSVPLHRLIWHGK